jgi:hypothetical protein
MRSRNLGRRSDTALDRRHVVKMNDEEDKRSKSSETGGGPRKIPA